MKGFDTVRNTIIFLHEEQLKSLHHLWCPFLAFKKTHTSSAVPHHANLPNATLIKQTHNLH
jgi:hypothetical protein